MNEQKGEWVMQKRKILLDVPHTGLLEKTKDIKENCEGWIDELHHITYREDEKTTVKLIVDENSLTIERSAENQTRIILRKEGKSEAWMNTEFGEFFFDVRADYIKTSRKMISTQYSLMQGKQLINQVHIRWIIKEEQ